MSDENSGLLAAAALIILLLKWDADHIALIVSALSTLISVVALITSYSFQQAVLFVEDIPSAEIRDDQLFADVRIKNFGQTAAILDYAYLAIGSSPEMKNAARKGSHGEAAAIVAKMISSGGVEVRAVSSIAPGGVARAYVSGLLRYRDVASERKLYVRFCFETDLSTGKSRQHGWAQYNARGRDDWFSAKLEWIAVNIYPKRRQI